MGIVFGVSGAEEPKYDVLKHIPYEIRIYKACFVAETTANDMNEAFQKLARYIGVFGDPENRIGMLTSLFIQRTQLLHIFLS